MTAKKVLIVFVLLALALAACGGSSGGDDAPATSTTKADAGSGDIAKGSAVYSSTCVACHGASAEGIDGLGLPLAPSEFVADSTEHELMMFIKTGRSVSDPDNQTGVDMPPKGGNPALSDADLHDVSAYLKSLN